MIYPQRPGLSDCETVWCVPRRSPGSGNYRHAGGAPALHGLLPHGLSAYCPARVIGVASVAMQIQEPFRLSQVSMKRSRCTTDLLPLVAFTAITPIAIAVFPKTRTVSDSGATCSSFTFAALTLARNSDLVLSEPSSSTRTSELSRRAESALTSPAL